MQKSFHLTQTFLVAAAAVLVCVFSIGTADSVAQKPAAKIKPTEASDKQPNKDEWAPLFNGKDLSDWKVTNFGGEGDVSFEKGNVIIQQGVDLSGITSTRKDLPRLNYEVEFEAQRAAGNDFFAGFTFPVGNSSCSLICGGWGGGVYGLSSLDGMDASENETTGYMAFTNGQWYKIKVKVADKKIEAWLDKDQIVDVETEGRKIDVRFEVDLSKPMGFSTYQSTAWIRNARIRKLPQRPAVGRATATK